MSITSTVRFETIIPLPSVQVITVVIDDIQIGASIRLSVTNGTETANDEGTAIKFPSWIRCIHDGNAY